jgi:uncharacterized membrane protein SpoIIM required for sporulation
MKVAELLEQRRENWRELELLCAALESRKKRTLGGESLLRFSSLYRAACADLALADSYQLPSNTIHYLHQLVGRAHNQLYRSRHFDFRSWPREMLYDLPQRLFNDGCLRLTFWIFWGVFGAAMFMAWSSPDFAEEVVGKDNLQGYEAMYSKPLESLDPNERGAMVGFYIYNNAGIGLRCFAWSVVLVGLLVMVQNALILGTVFGHMASVPESKNFFTFVTAHGPFELTAIVLGTAAGLRLGYAVVQTLGASRAASLREASRNAVPMMVLATILFGFAALIEGFLSPSPAPYWVKASVAVISSGALMFYFVMLGYPRS